MAEQEWQRGIIDGFLEVVRLIDEQPDLDVERLRRILMGRCRVVLGEV